MPPYTEPDPRLASIDEQTKWLVQIAAAIAGADEQTTRTLMERAAGQVDPAAVDEVIIQSYLFAGFPRTLNAARAWRTASGTSAPETDPTAELASGSDWIARGEQTCKTVYGESYEMLRENVRALHPALDSWMITDGYGKVLSRPGLSLRTRELCIVAACAASGQQRQLHSHLHGALNAGALTQDLMATLDALGEIVDPELLDRYRSLLSRVAASRRSAPVESADVR